MNKELEQKIIEMKFDNSDFEEKVARSLVTLKQLRESTKMEDAGKGLDNLSKSAKNLDLSHIADGIDKLNARFSNLGIVGMTVMQNLTNAAMNLGNQFMNALTEAPKGGMQTYESFISATKQLKNSAKDANGLPVTLEAVNKALDELNQYSDKTIYSFNDMTANIGKFTNAGVSLGDSVTAIKGISNVAASAGASAQNAASAMYNFGQALGTGVVKLIDWKSINNANMGTIEFKDQLIQTAEELGKLKKVGDRYISTTYSGKKANEEAFNASSKFEDSLQQQWMTSEVLLKTLEKYANDTSDVGKKAYKAATEVNTFSQMMSVFAESQKTSWSKTWRYIMGDYEESKQLFTGILNGLNWLTSGFNKWRNDFFKSWHDLGGRSELLSAFANIWETIQHYVTQIGSAFGMVFKGVDASPLVTVAKGFNAFTEKIKPAADAMEEVKTKVEDTAEAVTDVAERAEKFNEIVQQIINGEWGNGQERIDRLTEAGYAFENLQNAVNEVLGCEKRYETTMSDNEAVGISVNEVLSENAELLGEQAKSVDAIVEETTQANPVVGNLAKILLGVSSTVKVLTTGAKSLWNTLAKGASVLTVIKGAFGIILDIFGAIGGKIYQFNTWLLSFSSGMDLLNGFRNAAIRLSSVFVNLGVNLKNLGAFFVMLMDIFGAAGAKISSVFKAFSDGANALNFDKFKNFIFTVGKFIGGVLLISLDALAGIIVKVYNGLKDLKDTIAGMKVTQRLVGYFKNLRTEFESFVASVKDASFYTNVLLPILSEISKTVQRLGGAVMPILTDAFKVIKGWLIAAGNGLEKFYQSLKNSGGLEKVSTLFTNFKAALKSLPETITALYNSLKAGKMPSLDDFPEAIKNLVNSFKDLKAFVKTKFDQLIGKWFKGITDAFKNLPDGKKIGPFAGLVGKLKKAFEDFKSMTETAKGSVGLFLSGVIEKLSKIDFRGGAITALIGALGIFVFRWSKVGKSASKAIKAMGEFFKNGGKVAQTAVDKYNGFLKIAVAIGIIAGSIWLLAQVPADRFREVCITLGVAFAAMAGTILLLSMLKIPEDKMKAIGIAFAGLGAGFLAVAVAGKIIASMDWEELKKGGAALVVFTGLVIAAAKLAGKVGVGAGAAFVGLGLALLLLIPSIKIFSKMDAHTLIKGGAAVFAFMLMIAKAANVAGEAKGALGAFLGISLGLLLLIPSIKILSNMDAKTLLKGGAAVVALMFMMAEAAKRANGGSRGFIGMAVAIAVITGAMYVLAGLPWAALFMSSKSLSMVLISIAVALSKVGHMKFTEILKAVTGLALAVGIIGGALYLLTTYGDADAQLKSALGIAAILVAFRIMAPAIEALSKIPFEAGVVAAGNAMVFFGAMVLCLGALGEVASWGDGKVGDAIVNGANVIGRVIRGFIDGIMGKGEDKSEKIVKLGNSLSNFGGSMKGFLGGLYGVDDQTVTNAKNLATAILALCGADLLNALTGWLRGSKDLGSFSDTLAPLTQAVIDMNAALANETIDGEKIGQVSEIIKTFTDLAQSLPSTGGILQKLVGVKDLGTFAADMKEFMDGGFSDFVSTLGTLELPLSLIPKMMVIRETTSAMIELANALPKSGFISTFIDGSADLGEFATSMADFLAYDKYGLFVTRVSMVAEADLGKLRSNIIPATQEMINLANKIKENTSVIDLITGRKDLGKFGETLADFGWGIKKFADSLADVSTFKIVGITGIMYSLADLNASEKIKDDNLTGFARCITNLGKAIATYGTDTEAVSAADLVAMIDGLTNMHNLMIILSATDYSGVDNFIIAMQKLARNSVTEFAEEFTNNTEAATTAVTGFVTAVTDAFGGDKEAVQGKARELIVSYVTELTMFEGAKYMNAAGEAMMSNLVTGINNSGDALRQSADDVLLGYSGYLCLQGILPMQAAGKQILTSVIAGITFMYGELTKSALRTVMVFGAGIISRQAVLRSYGVTMVKAAYNGARSITDDFYDLGQDAADGYARGIHSKAESAAREARQMVSDAIEAARKEQDSASPSKVFRGLAYDAVDGYALGFRDNVSMVVDAVSDTGYAGIQAMQDTINHIHSIVDTNMDLSPTISPVLDLSEMMAGVNSANNMLSGMELNGLAATAAMSIAEEHNAALAQAREAAQTDYSGDLSSLIENTKKIVNAVKENRYAILDGDSAFNYFDRRMGMA